MSRPDCRKNPIQFSFVVHEWFLPASHRLVTRLAEQYRIMCGMSPAAGRTSGECNVVEICPYRSRRHEGNRPGLLLGIKTKNKNKKL
jgi:hypothetical protein